MPIKIQRPFRISMNNRKFQTLQFRRRIGNISLGFAITFIITF